MKMRDDFHKSHYEALSAEKRGFPMTFLNDLKGSTQKIFMYPNGYGASVVQGFMSHGVPELAVIYFENTVKIRSHKKRLKKKALKKAGGFHLSYDTPVTCDVKRYHDGDEKELQRDLNSISRLKPLR